MCIGNPLNLDRFLAILNEWRMIVSEDMDPAAAEKYVFKWFSLRLPEVLRELYLLAARGGQITPLKKAKK